MKDVLFTLVDVITDGIKKQVRRIKKLDGQPVDGFDGITRKRIAGHSKKSKADSDSDIIYHYGIDESVWVYAVKLDDLVTEEDVIERFKTFGRFLADQSESNDYEGLLEALTHGQKNWKVDQTSDVYPKPESRTTTGSQLVTETDMRKLNLTPEQSAAIRIVLANQEKAKEILAEADAS